MTLKQIKENLEVGDYILAAKLLKISPENVRTRLARNKNDVKVALLCIIENRKELIKNFHKSRKLF